MQHSNEWVLADEALLCSTVGLLRLTPSLEAIATTSETVTSGVTSAESLPGLPSTPVVMTVPIISQSTMRLNIVAQSALWHNQTASSSIVSSGTPIRKLTDVPITNISAVVIPDTNTDIK